MAVFLKPIHEASPLTISIPKSQLQRGPTSQSAPLNEIKFLLGESSFVHSPSVFEKKKILLLLLLLLRILEFDRRGRIIDSTVGSLTEKTRKTARNRIRDFHNPIGEEGGGNSISSGHL